MPGENEGRVCSLALTENFKSVSQKYFKLTTCHKTEEFQETTDFQGTPGSQFKTNKESALYEK